MATANPTRPNAPEDEARIGDASAAIPARGGPALKDPRSQSALDNIGVDDQANLLDSDLDEQPGDRTDRARAFIDDVRSDAQGHSADESGRGA